MRNDENRFPSKLFSSPTIGTTASIVTTERGQVHWGVLIGGAAASVVTIRSTGARIIPETGTADYFTVKLPIGTLVPLGPFHAAYGIEVLVNSGADIGCVLALSRPNVLAA